MARGRKKPRVRIECVDATPERIAMEESEFINPALIDSAQPIGLTRRFKSSHIDRLHRNGALSWVQWYAGDWFRQTYHRANFAMTVVASYGERTTGGELSYGLPRTEQQLRARKNYMTARQQFPRDMLGFMERLLIHDELPRYGGREAARSVSQIGTALDKLATWLKIWA